MNAQQSLEQARRLSDQPEYIQIAEVNRKHMNGEISNADRLRKIFQIRAEFSNAELEGIQKIEGTKEFDDVMKDTKRLKEISEEARQIHNKYRKPFFDLFT